MGLLNLALGQLLGLFLPLAAFLVALYFYDRSRRRLVVSTLRFWPHRPAAAVRQRHKQIQHPFSLALQLIALLLLLLAIADPRSDTAAGERHVVLLDTSAAMALPDQDGGRLMEQGKSLALAYLETLPGHTSVLLVEADGAPAVSVPFTTDRQRLREAIRAAEPSWTALDLEAAFELATGTLRLAQNVANEAPLDPLQTGETVYVGAGRIGGGAVRSGLLPNVRYLQTDPPGDSFGILALRAAASQEEPGAWSVELEARNYGSEDSVATVEFHFDDQRLGHRELAIPGGGDAALDFTLRTQRPGRLQARVAAGDTFPGNNEASVAIPSTRPVPLQVVGATEDSFGPLLSAGARIKPTFVGNGDELSEDAIHVWAAGGSEGRSRRAIYLAPPGTATPAGEAGSVRNGRIEEWSVSHPLARGVADPDLAPERARIFAAQPDDEVVARTKDGPVIVARSSGDRRWVAFGFDLAADSLRGRLAAPMLFANAVAWLDAGAFRPVAVEARPPGSVEIEADGSDPGRIAVRTAEGGAVPWLFVDGKVRFYAGQPGTYRVALADRDVTLFLRQPELTATDWEPQEVARGLPPRALDGGDPWRAWPWLAALAALILLYDWIRFGRGRRPKAEEFPATEAAAEEAAA